MTPDEFIAGIRLAVRDQAVRDDLSVTAAPPGRSPGKALVEIAEWYGALDPQAKEMVGRIVGRSVDTAVFGFLCVLDGVRAIDASGSGGDLVLEHRSRGRSIRLNDDKADMPLHDRYNST
jgi:hypothetical protein